MYPFVRLLKELAVHARAGSLPMLGTHVSRHICWPWDLDMFGELNNGRSLTLYDLGRLPLVRRTGLIGAMKANGWGMTMAGASVRWRRRVRVFDRVEVHSRCIGWDSRFFYIEQTMWRRGEAASSALYRAALTDGAGIVAPARAQAALGLAEDPPPLPPHVRAWIEAEALRPWPPA